MPAYDAPGVYIEEQEPGSRPIQGVGTAVAGFVGLTPIGSASGEPQLVTNWNQFKRVYGELDPSFPLSYGVYGFFQNGGGTAYIARVGAEQGAEPRAELPAADDPAAIVLQVTAPSGEAGLSVEVTDSPEGGDPGDYVLLVRRGEQEVGRYASTELKRGARGALALPGADPAAVSVSELVRGKRPSSGRYELAVPTSEQPKAGAFLGDAEARTGLGGLGAIDEVTMLVAPDLMWSAADGEVDLARAKTVQDAMVAQCVELHDRMAILDPPPAVTVQAMLAWRSGSAPDSEFAAVYYPWIGVYDPRGSQPLFVPPSGHMAGVWSRTDQQRGVHKAPANETIAGVLELQMQVTRAEQALLNPDGINVIRSFPGRGIRVWGARTLASSKQEWRYVNVRRLFNYLEESIAEGTQWAVFEPNDQDLWERIKRTVGAFLLTTWRDGALFGSKPEQAFYVKCDEETNPPDVIEQGRVVIEVGIAPVKPAEFVVFQIAQLTSGAMVGD